MERRRPVFPEFTSALSRTEAALVLAYFPVHLVLLPRLLGMLYERGAIDVLWANVLLYGVGFGYMLAAAFRFLRRALLRDGRWRNRSRWWSASAAR